MQPEGYCPFCHSDKVFQTGLYDFYCPNCRTYMSEDEILQTLPDDSETKEEEE